MAHHAPLFTTGVCDDGVGAQGGDDEGTGGAVGGIGKFKAQDVANTLWAFVTMGREHRAGLMRVLEGRAEAVAGTFKEQEGNHAVGVCDDGVGARGGADEVAGGEGGGVGRHM